MIKLIIFILLLYCTSTQAQVIWDINFNDRQQFEQWEEGFRDTIVARIGEKVGVYVNTEYSDTLIKIIRKYPYSHEYNDFYMSIVNELGAPNLIKDKEKKKKKDDPYYRPNPNPEEEEKDEDLADIIASGESTMQRIWLFPDFEIDLSWNKEGIIFSYKWLEVKENPDAN